MSSPPADSAGALILDAADRLFAERGYDGVSVRDVADEAGVTKALVFYHHQNKDRLFERVLERYYDAHRHALQGAYDPSLPVAERVHRTVDAYFDFIATHRHYPRLVQRAVASGGEIPRAIIDNLTQLCRWTEEAFAEVAPQDGPLAARHLFLTIAGAVINTFTYGPALRSVFPVDPTSPEGVAERRAHLRWLVDSMLQALPPWE